MKIDITTLMNKRAEKIDFDYTFDPASVDGGAILPDDMTLTAPVKVTGVARDMNNCMSLSCHVTVNYRTTCDRCLDEIDGVLEFDVEKTVSNEEMPEGAEDDPTFDDVIFVNESSLYIDGALTEEIALRLPTYHLCSEDCPGLCPKCGKKLTEGGCECKNEKEIDPRLKILQKLLDNFD